MTVHVYVFEGGECVTTDNQYKVDEFDREHLIRLAGDMYTGIANNEEIDWLDGISKIQDTFELMSPNFAQMVLDADDGGQLYFVRVG